MSVGGGGPPLVRAIKIDRPLVHSNILWRASVGVLPFPPTLSSYTYIVISICNVCG